MIKEIYVHVPAFLPETKRTFVKMRESSEQPSVWNLFESAATKNTAVLEFKPCLAKLTDIANVPLLGMKLLSHGGKFVLYHAPSKKYYAVCEQMLQFIQPFAHNLENTPMQLVNLTLVRDTVPSLLEEVSYNSFVPVEAIEIIKNTALNPSEDLPKYPLQVEEQRTSVSLDGSNVPHRYLVELLEDKTLIHFKVPGGDGWLNLQCISIINDVMNSDKDAYQVIKYNTGITSEFLQAKSSLQEISTIVEMNANDAWEDRAKESLSKLATIRAYCTFIQDFIDKYPSIVHNIYQDKLRDQFLDDEGATVNSQAVEFIKFSEMGHTMQNELAIDILFSLYFQELDSTRWFGKKSAVIVPSQEDNSSQLKAMRVAISSDKVPYLKFERTLACTFSESKYKVSYRINPGFEQRFATHAVSLEQLKSQLIGVEHTDIQTIKAWLAIALQDCYIGLVRMTTPKLSTMRLRLNNFHTTIRNIPIKRIEDSKALPVHEQEPFMAQIIQAYENSTN